MKIQGKDLPKTGVSQRSLCTTHAVFYWVLMQDTIYIVWKHNYIPMGWI